MLALRQHPQIAGSFIELVRSLRILHLQPQLSYSSHAEDDKQTTPSSSSTDGQGEALAEFNRKVAALQDDSSHSSAAAWLRAEAAQAGRGYTAAGDRGRSKGGHGPAAGSDAAGGDAVRRGAAGQALSADYGYAVLGGVDPEASQQVAGAQQPKLHPSRNFEVRDVYSPLDLSPLSREEEEPWVPQMRRGRRQAVLQPDEVRAQLDYKNIDFLLQFVTQSGRLKPRRQTRLKPRLQSRVSRAVKLARQMALLPYEMRVGDGGDGDRWRRMREFRAAEAGTGTGQQ